MMSEIATFCAGIGLTAVSSFVVMFYMKQPLQRVLVDLCGTQERANFWTAFSSIALVLVPIICAMQFRPDSTLGIGLCFAIIDQLKWALIGLVGTVVALGVVISKFIPRPFTPFNGGMKP